jgi:hypothetical protein
MKPSNLVSIFALAVAPILAVGASGCVAAEDDGAQSENVTALTDYTIHIDRMNAQYPDAVPIAKLSDPWTALVKIGDMTIPAPTHLFGDVINIIPYSNQDGGVDAQGKPFERGDMIIAKYFKPGKVGIGLKMHRPEHRLLDLNHADASAMKEDFKLQDTHIELVVGVDKAEHGKPGAITLNNPQDYEQGRFGNPTYSMIFLEPVYPGWAADLQAAYNDNVRAMLVGFNAVTSFPGDYNGGDPLGANSPERVREYVKQMVLAIGGDGAARAWFQEPANLVYCAELAFLAFSAGLIVPLNKATMEPLVGAAAWTKFTKEITKHNKGVDKWIASGTPNLGSAFVNLNLNKRVGMVRIKLAKNTLKPMASLAPNPEISGRLLALQPLTMADIVAQFMRTHIPRQIVGEQLAPVQAAVLEKLKPGLLEAMAMDQLPESDPRRQAVEALFAQIVEVVRTQYAGYAEFRAALEPVLEQARRVTGPRPGDESGKGLFVPPSLFHVAAQGEYHGLIGFQYLGHGVHVSNVQKKGTSGPPPDPVTPPTVGCGRDICLQGSALPASCDPCVGSIGAADPYCTATAWDAICVEKVTSVCGRTCP